MSEVWKRILVALFFLPLLIFFLFSSFANSLLFFLLVLLAFLWMVWESLTLVKFRYEEFFRFYLTLSFVWLASLLSFWKIFSLSSSPSLKGFENSDGFFWMVFVVFLFVLLFCFFCLETFKGSGGIFEKSLERIALHFFLLFYLGLSGVLVLILQKQNPYDLLYVWTIAWMSDSGAYFVGRLWGRHPLGLSVSPKKTWEGLLGGFIVSFASAYVLLWFFKNDLSDSLIYSFPYLFFFVFILSCFAVLGDLAESLLKRWAKQKDSSSLFPGHGGLLDVLDSLLYSLPIFYVFLASF